MTLSAAWSTILIGLAIAFALMTIPRRNLALKSLLQARSGQVEGSTGLTEIETSSLIESLRDRLYYRNGIAARSVGVVIAGLVVPAVSGLAMLVLGGGGSRALGVAIIPLGLMLLWLDSMSRTSARRKQFAEQLPQFLLTVSSAMSAGLTMDQALRELSDGRSSVVEEEFHRATQGLALGDSLESALEAMSQRMASSDIDTLRQATAIGRQTGSSLTPILETVAESSLERAQVRREIGTLTAEGLMSAYVVFLLLSQPDYVSVLWTRPAGIAMGVGALVLIAIGWVWLRRLISKETSSL